MYEIPPQEAKPRKKPRKQSGALGKFDKDLLQAVSEGVNGVADLRAKFRVADSEFDKRLALLTGKKLVLLAGDSVQLTVAGYNKLPKKREKKTTPAKPAPASSAGAASQPAFPLLPSPQIQEIPVPQAEVVFSPQPEEKIPAPSNVVDLAELLQKGAPKDQSFFVKRQQEKMSGKRSQAAQAESNGNEEKCELCKAPFKMAVRSGNPKYGHCFCGAAYHKDCYESVLSGNGRCVRCGKRMDLILDKQSEEALKRIRGLFD